MMGIGKIVTITVTFLGWMYLIEKAPFWGGLITLPLLFFWGYLVWVDIKEIQK